MDTQMTNVHGSAAVDLCKAARSLGLAGEAVAAERSLARQRASAEAEMHTASTGNSAQAYEVSLVQERGNCPLLLPVDKSDD